MKRNMKTSHMTISIPAVLRDEVVKHPEINWSAVASKAFERQLRAQQVLEQFAEAGVTEAEAIRRGLQLRHSRRVSHVSA